MSAQCRSEVSLMLCYDQAPAERFQGDMSNAEVERPGS